MRGVVYKRQHRQKNDKLSVLYYAVIETTRASDAKRSQDWGKGYPTRRQAERALRERVQAFEANAFTGPTKLTLAEYLEEHWLPQLRDRIKVTTRTGYKRMLDTYVVPRLGHVNLQELTTAHLNRFYAELRERGGKFQDPKRAGETRPLSPKTVRNVHAVLSKALNDAVDASLVLTNVAQRAKPPRARATSGEIQAWDEEELAAFLDFVADGRLRALWHLATHTGMRRGELLGLRWRDIDVGAQTLAVRQAITLDYTTPVVTTPKNDEARVVNLDDATMGVLRRHRLDQQQERLAWGEGYADTGLVFTREDGNLIHPDRASQLFDKHVRHSGIRRINFHGMRHTHATLMLKAGVPVKVVAERLGHADPAFTLRIYQHVLSGMQAEAAATFADVVRASRRHERAEISESSNADTAERIPDDSIHSSA